MVQLQEVPKDVLDYNLAIPTISATDACTRRQQFRLKAERKESRRLRKIERQREKAEKEKKGGKGKGKGRGKGRGKGKGKKRTGNEEADTDAKVPRKEGVATGKEMQKSPAKDASAKLLQRRGAGISGKVKKLNRLRNTGQKAECEVKASCEISAKASKSKSKKPPGKPPAKTKSTAKSNKGTSVVPEPKKRPQRASAEKEPKAKRAKHDSKKPSSRSKKAAVEYPADPAIKAEVTKVLEDCVTSGCTHPLWQPPEFDKSIYELSIYWTRHAVGVKMAIEYLPSRSCKENKSGKKGKAKKAQVEYFSCPTTCTYSNIILARKYVTWHWHSAAHAWLYIFNWHHSKVSTCLRDIPIGCDQSQHGFGRASKVEALKDQVRPDPHAPNMVYFAGVLKASHVEAVAEFAGGSEPKCIADA